MNRPAAVVRRDIIASTAPSVYGIQRMDKVKSSKGKVAIFLGICDGIVHLELVGNEVEPFIEIESEDFADWKKVF